jgi:Ca2+:H+ antiporter
LGTFIVIRKFFFGIQFWSFVVPITACAVFVELWGHPLGWNLVSLVAASLVAAVLVAVHHAEIFALRVGEPFGTLILALAITVIEVTLIVSLMISGGAVTTALARDTVFATVMITCNGAVGLCLLLGALRHRVLAFQVDGVNPALSVLATLTTLTLVLPTYTTSTPGPTFSSSQLAFAGVVSLMLYSAFVFIQTVRHHDDFLPVVVAFEAERADRPSVSVALMSLALMNKSEMRQV